MIISLTPMIAGFSASDVNTRAGVSRCGAMESEPEKTRATSRKSNGWTRIKRRAARCWNTEAALAQPLPTRPEGGQAVQKPRSSLYAIPGGLAVTIAGQPVANSTVLEVAR